MKTIKRLCSIFMIMVIVMVMMTVLTPTASAAVGGLWAGKFKSFTYIKKGSTGNFVGALQRYLFSFDSTAKSMLAYKNSAGQTIYVDSDFGSGTDEAVRYVQPKLGCKQDGGVAEETWGAIELDLKRYYGNNGEIILKRDLYNPHYVYKIIVDPYDPNGEVMLFYNGSTNSAGLIAFAWA